MKIFSSLILAITFFIALPSYSNSTQQKNNFVKTGKRFEKIDKNSDGLLSKSEMIQVYRERLDKLFIKFDNNNDNKLSKKELRALRKEIRKKIYKSKKDEG